MVRLMVREAPCSMAKAAPWSAPRGKGGLADSDMGWQILTPKASGTFA